MPQVSLRTPAKILLIVTPLLSFPVPALACRGGTFEQEVNEASDLVLRGSPVAALSCYEHLYNSPDLWLNQSARLEERFYWEFQDALLQAKDADPANRSTYLERATEVSETYVAWFTERDQDDKQQLQKRGQNRISNVLFVIGSAFEAMKDRARLLDYFERVGTHPEFFSLRSLVIWERTLRSFPNLDRERLDTEVREEIGSDFRIAEHWRAYRDFLDCLRGVPQMRHVADASLTKLRPIFIKLG